MKSKRRIIMMLTYATAVFLCATAQAGSTGNTTQNMLAGIYLGPAVMLHFAINWLCVGRRDESYRQRRCWEQRLVPRPKRRRRRIPRLYRMMFGGMVGGEGFEPPTYSV